MLSRILRQQRPLVIDPVTMLEISKRIFGYQSQQEDKQAGTSDEHDSQTDKEKMAAISV